MTPIALGLFYACYHGAQRAGCVYLYGAKPAVDADSSDVHHADCAGMVRWLIARATGGQVILPEGSPDQHAWCEAQGLHKVSQYSDLHYAMQDGSRLFLAFHNPEPVGHVWAVNMGRSIECHGPRGEPLGGRAWDNPILVRIADACYELPTEREGLI